MIDNEEIRYYAGFFDGEGHVQFLHDSSKKLLRPLSGIGLRIGICNTFEPIVQEFYQNFGGCIYERKQYNKNAKRCFAWHLSGDPAAKLLNLMVPHLRIKRGQAEAALVVAETLYSKVWRRGIGYRAGKQLSQDGYKLRELGFAAFRQDTSRRNGAVLSWHA